MRRQTTCLAAVALVALGAGSIALAQHHEGAIAADAAPAPLEDAGVPLDAASAIPPDAVDEPETVADVLPPGVGPITWAPSAGHGNCRRYRGRRSCEGPRRVPEPSLEALDRQRALALDPARARHMVTTEAPPAEWAAAAPSSTAPDDLLWPVDGGRLWRGYGVHRRLARTKSGRLRRARGRHTHEGVDIGADPGTAILAANDGLVAYSDNGMRGYGNVVLLVHRDGSVTLYAHCSATYVAAGDVVTRGQIIAAVGATGLAHGPHLHFEWRVAGRTRDPLRHFVGRPTTPAATDEEVALDQAPDDAP